MRLDDLEILEDSLFEKIALYRQLKTNLAGSALRFEVLEGASFHRVKLLNLTLWQPTSNLELLSSAQIPADVVAHVAWHRAGAGIIGATSADALLLTESIASAFDVYLVGRLLALSAESEFLETQVAAMAEMGMDEGLSDEDFEALLHACATTPEQGFETLRALLFDTARALVDATSASDAHAVLAAQCEGNPFGPLIHHFELSNWALYCRAYGRIERDPVAVALHEELRGDKRSLETLAERWLSV